MLLLIGLGLAGCGQSDPPAVGSDYFPLRDGASWSYLHSNRGWTEVVEVEALAEADSFLVSSSGDPDGYSSEATFVVKDGDVLRVHEDTFLNGVLEQSATYDPGFVRYSAGWEQMDAGETESRSYDRTETTAGMAAKDPVPRAHVYTVEALSQSVTVPAGTFQDCLRVRRERDLDAPGVVDVTVQDEQEKLYWFCPGVGKVREENVMTGTTELLMEYDLPEP